MGVDDGMCLIPCSPTETINFVRLSLSGEGTHESPRILRQGSTKGAQNQGQMTKENAVHQKRMKEELNIDALAFFCYGFFLLFCDGFIKSTKSTSNVFNR